MRESDIEGYAKKRAAVVGGNMRKVKFLDVNGAPDRILLVPQSRRRTKHSLIWIEFKRPGKQAELHQRIEHALLRSFDQPVHVIDTIAGVDEVIGMYFNGA